MECETGLQCGILAYVDTMDDRANTAYAAWPTWLDLVGLDGLVVYAGGLGSYGMKPNVLKSAIVAYLKDIEG